jgi:hypothetical protein
MNDSGSGRWMRTCEPSLALFTVSGCQTDVLVSDYSSKDRPSIGQETRWLMPAVEWPARRIFAPSITQFLGNSENLSTAPKETGQHEYLPARNRIRQLELQWMCRTASGRNPTRRLLHRYGGGIWSRSNRRQDNRALMRWSVPSGLLPRNFKGLDPVAAPERSLRRLSTDPVYLYHRLRWPYPTIPIEEPMSVLGGWTLYARGRRSMQPSQEPKLPNLAHWKRR